MNSNVFTMTIILILWTESLAGTLCVILGQKIHLSDTHRVMLVTRSLNRNICKFTMVDAVLRPEDDRPYS